MPGLHQRVSFNNADYMNRTNRSRPELRLALGLAHRHLNHIAFFLPSNEDGLPVASGHLPALGSLLYTVVAAYTFSSVKQDFHTVG